MTKFNEEDYMKQCKECKHYSNYEILRDLCPNGWCSRLDIPTSGDNNVCKYPKSKDAYSCSDCAKRLDGGCTTVGDKICESFEFHSNEHPNLIDEITVVCNELADRLSQVVDIPVGDNPDKQLTWVKIKTAKSVLFDLASYMKKPRL